MLIFTQKSTFLKIAGQAFEAGFGVLEVIWSYYDLSLS